MSKISRRDFLESGGWRTGTGHDDEPGGRFERRMDQFDHRRKAVHRRLISDLLELLGGSAAPVMSHLIEVGKLTLADVRALEKELASRKVKK